MLIVFGLLNLSDLFPILNELNLESNFEIEEKHPEKLKIEQETIDKLGLPDIKEEDMLDFTDSPTIDFRIRNQNTFPKLLKSIDIYEFDESYLSPLRVTKIILDDASDLKRFYFEQNGDNVMDTQSFVYYFSNMDGSVVLKYHNSKSAYTKSVTDKSNSDKSNTDRTNIFYVVFKQGIGEIFNSYHIVSCIHDVNSGIFEVVDSNGLVNDEQFMDFYKKTNISKNESSEILWTVKKGYDSLQTNLKKD
jgi:hypothetical protein